MAESADWKSTSCILCSTNCGLQVQIENGHFTRIKGDKTNPRSRGYTCEKPAGLDHYQNHADRITRAILLKELEHSRLAVGPHCSVFFFNDGPGVVNRYSRPLSQRSSPLDARALCRRSHPRPPMSRRF